MNPITDPPRLFVRFLDDVHMIAVSSAKIADTVVSIPEMERRLRGDLEGMDRAVNSLLKLAEDTRATLSELEVMQVAVEQLNASASILAAAVEPLQGIAEGMGRLAGRIPGALRAAGGGTSTEGA